MTTNLEHISQKMGEMLNTGKLRSLYCIAFEICSGGAECPAAKAKDEKQKDGLCSMCHMNMLSWLGDEYKEVSPYDDFTIDEPVEVTNDNWKTVKKGHFAGVSLSKKPMIWDFGGTSFSTETKSLWEQARRVKN